MEINQCTALVTGGASGMGAATAQLLSARGARVAILDLNQEAAHRLAKTIKGMALHCDITQEKSVEAALNEIIQQWGPPRICINCAGIISGGRIVGKEGPLPLEIFRQVIDINLTGTFNVMRLTAAAMMKLSPIGDSEERGVIINTTSIAAMEGQVGQAAYSASKGGVLSLTLPAAREFAPWGIRVVTLAPGLMDTPMVSTLKPNLRQSLVEQIPFPKRLGSADEYAKLALHVIENAFINGTIIRLDGALRMQ